MKKFARALAQDDGFKDATAIGAQLSALNLTADCFFQSFTRRTKREARENSESDESAPGQSRRASAGTSM
ncbi:hypothetical protein [Microbacterium sp. E-13]|uniref:hypothetical protein n=1 Tax=Microbacterium sp. E-13 TaxID=3404048 RepID=UPI003CFA3732